jgi:glutamine synthetase
MEEGGNLANKTPYKGGYFPVSPVDHFADLRDDICLKLEKPVSLWSVHTTRWEPVVRLKSTTASTPW